MESNKANIPGVGITAQDLSSPSRSFPSAPPGSRGQRVPQAGSVHREPSQTLSPQRTKVPLCSLVQIINICPATLGMNPAWKEQLVVAPLLPLLSWVEPRITQNWHHSAAPENTGNLHLGLLTHSGRGGCFYRMMELSAAGIAVMMMSSFCTIPSIQTFPGTEHILICTGITPTTAGNNQRYDRFR